MPTGNFGDIFAGYLARQMGLPVQKLLIATNANDVLHRILSSGTCTRRELQHTLSPSMDITVSSNFERLLFDLYQRDSEQLAQLMHQMQTQEVRFSDTAMAQARQLFLSARVSDEQTCATIREVYQASEYLLDPHSAIGVKAARDLRDSAVPMVTLATAHPAKFAEAIVSAGVDVEAALPRHMANLFERPERYEILPNDLAAVQRFMLSRI